MGPCGGAERGVVMYEGFPGQLNEVAWFVHNAAPNGKCAVRINTGFEEDEIGFEAMRPSNKDSDVMGYFECGRTRNVYEKAIFRFPKTSCDPCVL